MKFSCYFFSLLEHQENTTQQSTHIYTRHVTTDQHVIKSDPLLFPIQTPQMSRMTLTSQWQQEIFWKSTLSKVGVLFYQLLNVPNVKLKIVCVQLNCLADASILFHNLIIYIKGSPFHKPYWLPWAPLPPPSEFCII